MAEATLCQAKPSSKRRRRVMKIAVFSLVCAALGVVLGVAMARGPSLVNHLKSVKRSLRSLRLSPKSIKATDD